MINTGMDSTNINSLPHNGTATSIAAGLSMEEIAVQDRVLILRRLVKIEPEGSTADAMQVYLMLQHQSNSPRFTELEDDGLVYNTKAKRPTRSGRGAFIRRPTPLGISAIEEGWYRGDRINKTKRESHTAVMRGALAEALRGWASNTTDPVQLARIAVLEHLTKVS